MKTSPPRTNKHPPSSAELEDSLRKSLEPLVELALKFGVTEKQFAELVRRQYIASALEILGSDRGGRIVSRLATMTSLSRREVTMRLSEVENERREESHSAIGSLYTKWKFQKPWCTARGKPKRLPIRGDGPTFENLCKELTQDVHHASLLRELQRLQMVSIDQENHRVELTGALMPVKSEALKYLGDNIRAHAKACVANVTEPKPKHFEQVIFADELSDESIRQIRALVESKWKDLLEEFIPMLLDYSRTDKQNGTDKSQLRIGLYEHHEDMPSDS